MTLPLTAEPEPALESPPDPLRHAIRKAWAMIQRQRLAEAEALLVGLDTDNLNVAVPLRLLRNLDAMERHRPELFETLMAAGPVKAARRYSLVVSPSGHAVPAMHNAQGRLVQLGENADPQDAAMQAMTHLTGPIARGEPILFADVIDGYLLTQVAGCPPTLEVGQRLPVYVAELDPYLVLTCLMLHDWTGAGSPILDPRFTWFVGEGAYLELERHLREDVMLVPPGIYLGRESHRQAMSGVLARVRLHNEARMQDWRRRVDEHYADFDAEALRRGVMRKPRVLLVTSRFTTVLQHATADAEAAFTRLGWRARTVIEPGDTHRVTRPALLRALATFKPDLVFAIDFLRSHAPGVYPEGLPYVCWVQDHLGKLTNVEAGRSVTPRDFILTMVGPMYTGRWEYPARQVIETPKLTRPPVRPATWRSAGADLVYVSNASQQPAHIVAAMADPLLRACGERMLEYYGQSQPLPTMWHVGNIVDEVCGERDVQLPADQRALAVNHLCLPLNNALYRQQALRWVADTAREFGLTFELYGHGWGQHPDFAAFAKGPVAYGSDLEQLTRDAKINLQVIPSFCLHQRLLDGLVAGGFFLVRQHPSDTLMPRLLALLDADSQTVGEALEAARHDPARFALLRAAFKEAECLTDLGTPIDLVAWLRGCRRGELMNDSGVALPRLEETSFSDHTTFRQAVGRFIDDGGTRRRIAHEQRESVEHRLSYTAGLRRTLARIGRLIAEEPQAGLPLTLDDSCRAA